MSLVSTFVDAFKKAAGKQPTKPEIDLKTYGPLGHSTPESAGGAFDPLRPAPEAEHGKGIDRGDVSGTGELTVSSADPEEGGEVTPELASEDGKGIDHADVSLPGEPKLASSDPEEGGEVIRP